MLNGLDEIALVERHVSDIDKYESQRVAWLPAVK
jgi:3-isopropylmalate dehydratase small subunit